MIGGIVAVAGIGAIVGLSIFAGKRYLG